MLQEQNSVPGMTNRVLARFADRIYTAYEEAGSNFTKEKVVCSGNPLREEILQGKREEAMESFGMSPERMTLVILGGSRGAHAINQLVSAMIRDKGWSALPVQFLHQTGEADYEAVCEAYHDAGIKAEVRPYFDDMGLLYRAADLAISRAGAVALSELMAVGVPAILIPFPFAADDHQMRNAKICASSGAATVFAEEGLTPKKLGGYVQSLLENREQLSSMKEAAKRQGRSDAARRVIDDIEQVVGRGT
jgi:UDP-N-acetylglucosamine--N-acetylmuramyl-(pentapeptide) pyrophosphoryl-undecaprenol N-acetylglucosamine transferase